MKSSLALAVLCDSATVREGLIHILGGGITSLPRPTFPAPMASRLAVTLYLELDPAENVVVKVGATCRNAGGDAIYEVEVEIYLFAGPDPAPSSTSLAIPLENAGVPEPGIYGIDITVDGELKGIIPFSMTLDSLPQEGQFG